MEQTVEVVARKIEKGKGEKYQEPLLIKHEPLRDITGQKYGADKAGIEL